MIYLLLFIFELALLFFLSKRVINSLSRIIFKVTRSHRVVVHTLAIIFLPGTIIHELAHLLFAGVMFVPVGEMNVLPEIEETSVKLGSVQIGKTDPFRRIIVGVAPVLLGLILIFSIFLLVKIGSAPWWQVTLAFYLLFEIGNTMFSSRKDIEGSILFIILIVTLSLAISATLYFLSPNFLQSIWSYVSEIRQACCFAINFEFAVGFFKQASLYLAVPVALDILIILLTAPFLPRR